MRMQAHAVLLFWGIVSCADFRPMNVVVVDDTGAPVDAARIAYTVCWDNNCDEYRQAPRCHFTNVNGRTRFDVDDDLDTIAAFKSGFERGTRVEETPSRVRFVLKPCPNPLAGECATGQVAVITFEEVSKLECASQTASLL